MAKKKKTTKKPAAKPSPAKEQAAERKQKAREAINRKVKKITEMSSVTAQQAMSLVDAYDEADAKADELKEQIGGLKGQISKHKAEIREVARDFKSLGKSKDEQAEAGNTLAGLERDVQRWELKLSSLTEERGGHRETMKATMHELRTLIRDKAAGGLLFEKDEEHPAAGKPKGDATAPPATSAAISAASVESTPPSTGGSKGKEQPAKPTLKPVTIAPADHLASIKLPQIASYGGIDLRAIELLEKTGITTLREWKNLADAVMADGTGKVKFPKGLTGTQIEKLDKAAEYFSKPNAVMPPSTKTTS